MDQSKQPYNYTGVPQVGFSNTGQGQLYMPPPPPPGAVAQWMQRPNPLPGCPPGLEYLTMIDRLVVQQQVELLEAFTGWETNNKYSVRNANGQQVYFAFEKTDTCMRLCCGPQRSFTMHIVDNLNQEVLRVSREFKCCAGCCWCAGCCDGCAHEVTVSTPTGEVLGYVKQSCWVAKYHILDAERNKVLDIEGPCCILNGPFCPCENAFNVIGTDGSSIGKVSKNYSGFVREMFTSADTFTINFPIDLNVKVKSTLIGAMFLIDFMFFEQKQNN